MPRRRRSEAVDIDRPDWWNGLGTDESIDRLRSSPSYRERLLHDLKQMGSRVADQGFKALGPISALWAPLCNLQHGEDTGELEVDLSAQLIAAVSKSMCDLPLNVASVWDARGGDDGQPPAVMMLSALEALLGLTSIQAEDDRELIVLTIAAATKALRHWLASVPTSDFVSRTAVKTGGHLDEWIDACSEDVAADEEASELMEDAGHVVHAIRLRHLVDSFAATGSVDSNELLKFAGIAEHSANACGAVIGIRKYCPNRLDSLVRMTCSLVDETLKHTDPCKQLLIRKALVFSSYRWDPVITDNDATRAVVGLWLANVELYRVHADLLTDHHECRCQAKPSIFSGSFCTATTSRRPMRSVRTASWRPSDRSQSAYRRGPSQSAVPASCATLSSSNLWRSRTRRPSTVAGATRTQTSNQFASCKPTSACGHDSTPSCLCSSADSTLSAAS